MASQVPRQFFIVADPKLSEYSATASGGYPLEAGAYVSAAVANTANKGDLQAFGTGTPASDFDAEIRLQRGGDTTTASYVYRDSGGTDEDYYGEPDRRFMRDVHSPFPNDNYIGIGATAFYAPLADREVLVIGDNFMLNRVRLAYRDVNSTTAREDGGGWTYTTINLVTEFNRGCDFTGYQASDACMIDACVREDGTVFIVVKYEYDMDLYSTTDGITWTLRTAGILSNYINIDPYPNSDDLPNTYGRLGQLYNIKIASSGDFLRIAYAGFSTTASDIFIKVLGSSNSGASWVLIEDDKTTEATNISGGDRFGFDIVGLRNGQFMLTATDQHYMMIRCYTGTGMGIFSYVSSLSTYFSEATGPNQAPRIYLARGADWLLMLLDNNIYEATELVQGSEISGKRPEINLYWIDLGISITEGVLWNNMGRKKYTTVNGEIRSNETSITGFKGSQRYNFARGKLYNRGDCIALFAGMFDNQSTQDISLRAPVYMRFGGWSKRPIDSALKNLPPPNQTSALIDVRTNPVNGAIQRGRGFNYVEWRSAFGAPAGILYASVNSYWDEYRISAPTRAWTANRLRITNYDSSDMLVYVWEDPSQDLNSSSVAQENIPQYSLGFYALNYTANYKWNGEQSSPSDGPVPYIKPLGTVNGSCICFTARVPSGGERGTVPSTLTAIPRGAGVEIHSYVKSIISPNAADQTLGINITLSEDGVDIADTNDLTILTQITISDLNTDFYEFRLGIRPATNTNGSPLYTGHELVECCLAYRKVGTDSWSNTNTFTLNTNPRRSERQQKIRWGNFQMSAGNSVTSEWRDFSIHAGSDLGVFALKTGSSDYPDIVRGRNTSSERVRLDEGVDIIWGGASASVGDLYTLSTEYTNGFDNANLYDSPRIRWSSGTATNFNSAQLNTTGGTGKEGFVHNAIAAFGTNAKEVVLRYGSSLAAAVTISMLRATGRVAEFSDNAVRVEWDQRIPAAIFSSSIENRKYFARLTNVPAGLVEDTGYLISRHYYDRNKQHWLECAGVTMSFAVAGAVGMTVSVYADRGWAVYDGVNVDDSVRWELHGSNWNAYEESNKSQELYAGRLLAGTTLSMHPLQMDWNNVDSERSSVSLSRTRSGITWGYREGATTRVIKGEFQGDVSEQVRRYVRDTMRAATNFNERGLVFVGYEGDRDGPLSDDYFMLARFDDNIDLKNVGWYHDEYENKWRPVGNLTLTLTEIV
jgi:hypothetical protein